MKGYEFKKNTHVLLNNEDFESVKVESSSIMNIETVVELGSIDPLHYDTSYFLAPDGDAGKDVYAVLYGKGTGQVALSRVVIARRARTIALRPMEGVWWGILCTSSGTSMTPRPSSRTRPPSRPIQR